MTHLADGYHALAPGKVATVVTFLEMTAPPDRQEVAAPDGVGLEPVGTWDLDAFRALYREIGHEWLWSARLLIGEEALRAVLAEPERRAFLPMRDGRPLGLLEMDFAASDAVEVSFFGVIPAAVGGGLGRYLMDRAIRMAFSRPQTRRLWLHTCHFDSPRALPFYQAMGFRPYARAVEVFDDPRLAGVVEPTSGPAIPVIRQGRLPDPC